MLDYTKLKAKVRDVIPEKRFRHSEGVAETALLLAERFGIDQEKALLCGIYHDAYRYSGTEEMVPLLQEKGFILDPEEIENPMLLHGPVAAMYFSSFVGEEVPQDMVDAVRHHTLGHKAMGRLGAAIYIADYAEPGRVHLTEKDRERIFSCLSLESMVLEILDRERRYFKTKGMHEAKVTAELHEYLSEGGRL